MEVSHFLFISITLSYFLNKRKRIAKGATTKGQSRETDNIGYTKQRKTEQKHNTIYVGNHHTETNTNSTNKPSFKQE